MRNKTKKLKNLNAGMTHSIKTQGHSVYCRGMTYVELIVVLSIFATMSAVVMFNYGRFQARVDVKNLASDIALKISEAQKSSASGVLPATGAPYDSWKPSYGVYFDSSNLKDFAYFINSINSADNNYDGTLIACNGECMEKVTLTKNYEIKTIESCNSNDSCSPISGGLSITFKRPDVRANFVDSGGNPIDTNYVKITVGTSDTKSVIKLSTAGRIQIN